MSDHIEVRRTAGGRHVVVVEPAAPGIRRRTVKPCYSSAMGFAVRLASTHGRELRDTTGRVTPEQCAALVAEDALIRT